MDASAYPELIQQVLSDYNRLVNPKQLSNRFLVFDKEQHHYLYMVLEWDDQTRLYGITLHVDIIDGKIWIQRDGSEDGIIDDFLNAGVPKEHIVLGYRSPFVRQHTEFAVS